MKIVTVIGARPQFIKAAAVSRKLREKADEILVHSGQHYDANMSDIFFEQLDIPRPEYNLGAGSGSHAVQTADILVRTEEVLLKEKPDYCLVYGDTNSTLAGALAASKLLIPVIHVEAGLRSFNKAMPEEQNRVLTDHISTILFCPTQTAVDNLINETITENVYVTGDVMYDAVLHYKKKMETIPAEEFTRKLTPLFSPFTLPQQWYIATVHRAENTKNTDALREILSAFEELDAPVLFPVHPRIKGYVTELNREHLYRNVFFTEPFGYLEMLYFTNNSIKVVTDSGGLQKEAYMLGKNVVTLRDQTEWVETLRGNHNILCGINKQTILDTINRTDIDAEFDSTMFGAGDAADKMISIICGQTDTAAG